MRSSFLAIVIGLCLAISPGAAQQTNPFAAMRNFSATQIIETGGRTISAKIYRSGDKMRMDMEMPNSRAGGMHNIANLATGDAYAVMAGGMCMHMRMNPQMFNTALLSANGVKLDRVAAGSETINGHPCKIEDVTATEPGKAPVKSKVWEAQDLHGFPLKLVYQTAGGQVTTVYKDVSLSAPDASLFAQPSNCRDMPMGNPFAR